MPDWELDFKENEKMETLPATRQSEMIDFNSQSVIDTLMATVAQGLTKQEFNLFAQHCKGTGLNPFKKEVWAIKAGGRLQIMTGNQGFHTIANSHQQYDGMETGFVGGAGEYLPMTYPKNDYIGAWAKVYRKDRRIAHEAVAMLAEYDKGQSNWKTMRRIMIVKCAESLALRKAFPQELNGIYTAEEMPTEYAVEQTEPRRVDSVAAVKTVEVEPEQPAIEAQPFDPNEKLWFGKHKGQPWSEVNQDYLAWLVDKHDPRISPKALAEIERRAVNQPEYPEVWKGDDLAGQYAQAPIEEEAARD